MCHCLNTRIFPLNLTRQSYCQSTTQCARRLKADTNDDSSVATDIAMDQGSNPLMIVNTEAAEVPWSKI